MKKILCIVVVLIVIVVAYSLFSGDSGNDVYSAVKEMTATNQPGKDEETKELSTVTPEPTFIPEWPGMSYEEKVQYYQRVEMKYIEESSFGEKGAVTYSQEYYLMVKNGLLQEAREKYDMVFKRKTRTNVEYLLLDFDTNEFMLLLQSKYGRNYGKFKGSANTDWTIVDTVISINSGTTFRCKNDKLYYVAGGELNDSEFVKCDIDEPLQYILRD